MSITCIKCNGATHKDGNIKGKQAYKCKVCKFKSVNDFNESEDKPKTIFKHVKVQKAVKRYVITSALNDVDVCQKTLAALELYCKHHKAQLIVVPVAYRNSDALHQGVHEGMQWPAQLSKYYVKNRMDLNDNLTIGADLPINSTSSSPLNGLEAITGHRSTIVPHAKIALKTIARPKNQIPKIIVSTGSVSKAQYSKSAAGVKAAFHHSNSAVFVELLSESRFLIRHLHVSSTGELCDLDKTYARGKVTKSNVEAIIFGDLHEKFLSLKSRNVIKDMIKTLKPKYRVFHDSADAFSVSHHHEKDPFILAAKANDGSNCLLKELTGVVNFLEEVEDKNGVSVIVNSNHDRHIQSFLSRVRLDQLGNNFFIAIELLGMIADSMKAGHGIQDAFQLYLKKYCKARLQFTDPDAEFLIKGVDVGQHSDRGPNGSRGSLKSFARCMNKCVIGHSHTAGIEEGAYQVGSSTLDLGYATGLSSWTISHCLLYKNGKRSLIFVMGDRWK